ncbi:MAG: transposase, partial [Cyclobacteriaceae bacterium]|nr:transposase [Cyclobacteriaceae bacterium]
MFKRSDESPQVNLFTSGDSLFFGKSLKLYQDPSAWHNQFRNQVTMRVDEEVFEPLYSSGKGTPNASIRVLIAMMVLKEAEGMSDEKLFENCRFNMLMRSALGLINADDAVPTESTYYLFRKNVNDYAKEGNENLFETVFASITKKQCLDFNVSGKRIRMDSKLLGSNIAWLSRYELVHETLRLLYKKVKKTGGIGSELEEKMDQILQFRGNKVVYTSTSEEVKTKLQELGELIYKVLPLFCSTKSTHYTTLERVFHEQFRIDEAKLVITRNKEEISAKSIQSP